jgi:uracil-DNA glycosylase family 4
VAYRRENAARRPEWFNGAVPSFGDPAARLLVLGLAPGVAGGNRTGRPFSGDDAGDFLHATLARFGLADCLISNAVACVPPRNRPTAGEIAACRPFLVARLAALPNLRAVLCLGRIAHETLVRALGGRPVAHPFAHGARHELGGLAIFDSYHCSRYNRNTGRLTPATFEAVLAGVRGFLDAPTVQPLPRSARPGDGAERRLPGGEGYEGDVRRREPVVVDLASEPRRGPGSERARGEPREGGDPNRPVARIGDDPAS